MAVIVIEEKAITSYGRKNAQFNNTLVTRFNRGDFQKTGMESFGTPALR